MVMRTPTRHPLCIACLAILVCVFGLAGPAQAAIYGPPKGKVFTGVSDDGTLTGFDNFTATVGKHPALLQTFHPWGNGLDQAYKRWQRAEVRPILHISTADDETQAELITPKQIALGNGDDYLLSINSFFYLKGLRAYIRPLGEPNRCLNPYSAVYCSGRQKGGDHTTTWYKRAFRRIALIVRGGQNTARIDKTLANLGMPPVNFGATAAPAALPAAPVAIIWSPLPAGSPRVKGNWPGNYWPGSRYVDWAGTDFYSNYPYWRDLNKFMAGKPWRNKPVSITEWGVVGKDDVTFTRQFFHWVKIRPRVRMLAYYRGFGLTDPYNDYYYPQALKVVKNQLKDPRFLSYAYEPARPAE